MSATSVRENGLVSAPNAIWSAPLNVLLEELRATSEGLSEDDAAIRLGTFGRNTTAQPKAHGVYRLVWTQLTSPITLLLLVAAILSMALGERADATVILGILFVSGALGTWQERRAANAVEGLLALVRSTTTVRRSPKQRDIPIEEVVPGDVVCLTAGATVPADARILESKDLFVDESALTGESYPAEKGPGLVPPDAPLARRSNVVHLGTHVVSGTATVLACRTGMATEFGKIAHQLVRRPAYTEFELGVRRFGHLLLEITTVLVVVIFAVNVALDRPVLDALLFTLALAVGLTPQLLPAIVSVTLSQGARHMAGERVIVRRLASIEDLGGMQILCTDKTGTITEGIVTLHSAEDWHGAHNERITLFAHLNAAFETGFPNPIDDALRAATVPGAEQYTKADEVPYDFIRKRLSVAVSDGSRRVLITKGALESVLAVCDSAEDAAGNRVPLAEARSAIKSRFEALSRDAYRSLGIAYRTLPPNGPVGRADEQGLSFLGILSFADPLKETAAKSLEDLARLGIRVKVVTGDNRYVAARMAAEAGLDASTVLTGSQIRQLPEPALVRIAARVSVFAEVEPNQKERIILALKRTGTAVGYLGDGINDAPALHAADVGISVDSATDVTKQAADIVLLEKDLAVLGRGVREGRRAFANTLKYIFITTSANFGNMFSMAGASLFAAFLPLLPKQILLINVLTDLPAMSIAADRLDPELVERPRRWDNRVIRRFMLTFGLISSVFDYLTLGVLLWLRLPPAAFRTAWFLESVLSELLILLVIRTRRPFFKSPPGRLLLYSTLVVGAATLLLPYSSFAGLLGFAPLSVNIVGIIATIVLAYVAASELSKPIALRAAPLST
jgi:Mg2+-importing ATPase